ncbi:MAG: nuclease-related domain-containing protein [Anaerolineaceae bacterium]
MKQVIDRNRINKNALLSNIASIGGLLILMASVILPVFVKGTSIISGIMMVVGLGVAMVGIYFANRWVRKPRPEDRLDKVLKGLSEKYVLFHYPHLPSDHILLTPASVIVIETINIGGDYFFKNGKWKENMTIGRAIRYIVEEHLGDPCRAAKESANAIHTKLNQIEGLSGSIPVKPVVVFTHPATQLESLNPPIPVMKVEKLRKHVDAGTTKLPQEDYDKVFEFLEANTR